MSVIALLAAAALGLQAEPAAQREAVDPGPGAQTRAAAGAPAVITPDIQAGLTRLAFIPARTPGDPSGSPVTRATAMDSALAATRARAMVTGPRYATVYRNRTVAGCAGQNIGGVNAEEVNGDVRLVTIVENSLIVGGPCER